MLKFSKFRKKPVVIDAVRVPLPDQFYEWGLVWGFLGETTKWHVSDNKGVDIETLEGTMRANPGDWIIRGVAGEFYPIKAAIFKMTYEPVDEA